MTASANPATLTVIGSIERGPDLTVRVRRVKIAGLDMIDIREYVPSSETYGRGILVPANMAKPLIAAIKEA